MPKLTLTRFFTKEMKKCQSFIAVRWELSHVAKNFCLLLFNCLLSKYSSSFCRQVALGQKRENLKWQYVCKGCLISESFSIFENMCQITILNIPPKRGCLGSQSKYPLLYYIKDFNFDSMGFYFWGHLGSHGSNENFCTFSKVFYCWGKFFHIFIAKLSSRR